MLTIDNFVFDTLKRLDSLKMGNCLDIRSYKKNRKVIVEKLEDTYNVYEDGFVKEEYLDLSKEDLKKLLKTIEKVEFPRSNKLRIYILSEKEESSCRANYREEFEVIEEEIFIGLHVELPYSLLTPVKNMIEILDGEVTDVIYGADISIVALIPEDNLESFKNFLKDNPNAKIFSR